MIAFLECVYSLLSNEVLIRIQGASYVSNKEKHNDYLWCHILCGKETFYKPYSLMISV